MNSSRLQFLFALLAGALFGLGLAVSQMINPAKVIGFLDVSGRWDPTLAFVMLGALAVTGLAFRVILKRSRPWFAERFSLPTKRDIDPRLVGGGALFGIGWGLSGLCPGPALAALVTAQSSVLVFVGAMLAGSALYSALDRT